MLILVSGAAGFIGSHLGERLLARGDRVIGLDNFDPFYPRSTKERNLAVCRQSAGFTLVEGDVRAAADVDAALAAAGGPVDAVVHLAALPGVRPSQAEPERFYDVNVVGTARVLERGRAAGVKRFLVASSSSVYGHDTPLPFPEDAPCNHPLSVYAASKRAAELVAWTAHQLHGLSVTCLRLFTAFGPRQRPDLAIHRFVSAISQGDPIEIFGDGTSSRDYTFIDDIVDGLVSALDRQSAATAPAFELYNLGGARATTVARLVELIAATLERSPRVVWKPEQPAEMKRTLADLTRAQRDLGYAPKVGIREGLERFVAWWRTDRLGS